MDARNCGNCKHFGRRNGGTDDICLNPSCGFSKEQTGVCDFRLVTNEKFVCNLHEYENKENEIGDAAKEAIIRNVEKLDY
jgi:hypothetical protein